MLTRQVRMCFFFTSTTLTARCFSPSIHYFCRSSSSSAVISRRLFSSETDHTSPVSPADPNIPMLLDEGVFAVHKPMNWTSSNVVGYIRGILERDARTRGHKPAKVGSRRKNRRVLKVGHGGTLDPMATGVLVIGVGSGTKVLGDYLKGSKAYIAGAELGFETTTLDTSAEGNVTRNATFDHVTADTIHGIIPEFTGKIQQVPPIFSALKQDGERLYKKARKGITEEELKLEPREVEVHGIELLEMEPPKFRIRVECGGGFYIRSLIRDMARRMDSAATMYSLERTKQGPFTVEDCLTKDDWCAENIYRAIAKAKKTLIVEDN